MPEKNNEAHFLTRPFPWKRPSNYSGKGPLSKASFCLLLDQGEEKEALPEWRQTFELTAAQVFKLVNLV